MAVDLRLHYSIYCQSRDLSLDFLPVSIRAYFSLSTGYSFEQRLE